MATALERFEAKVDRSGECWLWMAGKTPAGYGQFRVSTERKTYAHRFAYEMWVGPIPSGMEIDHLCFNRACVRPEHLEAVTSQQNHERRRGRPRAHRVTAVCRHGHPREGNTGINARGARFCVICHRESVRRHSARARQGGQ